MKTLLIMALVFLTALTCGSLLADLDQGTIRPGSNIDDVTKLMNDAGYIKAQLAMETSGKANSLRMWGVGDGVLICNFTSKDKTVTAISYFFCDERAKSMRMEIDLKVKEYNPRTREMQILVLEKAREPVKAVEGHCNPF